VWGARTSKETQNSGLKYKTRRKSNPREKAATARNLNALRSTASATRQGSVALKNATAKTVATPRAN